MILIKKQLPISKTIFFFFGQQRSGHHAVMYWILQDAEYQHFNICTCKNDKIFSNDIYGKSEIKVASFEGLFPKFNWNSINAPKVLVLRNPYNMYASRLAMKRASTWRDLRHWNGCLDPSQWIQHAKEFIGETNELGDCIKISYDHWYSEPKYRKKLSERLNIHSPELLDKISEFGGGSSFDPIQTNASEMDVLNRWKTFEKDDEFQSILDNDLLKNLWSEASASIKLI